MSRPKEGCWNCIYSRWKLSESGRRMSAFAGTCEYEVPPLPSGVVSNRYASDTTIRIHDAAGRNCPVFEKGNYYARGQTNR